MFADAAATAGVRGECVTHGRTCRVPPVDILVVTCSLLHESAFTAYVDAHRPRVVVVQNLTVSGLGCSGSTPQSMLLENTMASFGYEGQTLLLDAAEFGSPKSRKVMYLVFVGVVSNPLVDFRTRTIDDMFNTFNQLVSLCRRSSPCFSSALLPPGHPAIDAELNRRLQLGPRLITQYRFVCCLCLSWYNARESLRLTCVCVAYSFDVSLSQVEKDKRLGR